MFSVGICYSELLYNGCIKIKFGDFLTKLEYLNDYCVGMNSQLYCYEDSFIIKYDNEKYSYEIIKKQLTDNTYYIDFSETGIYNEENNKGNIQTKIWIGIKNNDGINIMALITTINILLEKEESLDFIRNLKEIYEDVNEMVDFKGYYLPECIKLSEISFLPKIEFAPLNKSEDKGFSRRLSVNSLLYWIVRGAAREYKKQEKVRDLYNTPPHITLIRDRWEKENSSITRKAELMYKCAKTINGSHVDILNLKIMSSSAIVIDCSDIISGYHITINYGITGRVKGHELELMKNIILNLPFFTY